MGRNGNNPFDAPFGPLLLDPAKFRRPLPAQIEGVSSRNLARRHVAGQPAAASANAAASRNRAPANQRDKSRSTATSPLSPSPNTGQWGHMPNSTLTLSQFCAKYQVLQDQNTHLLEHKRFRKIYAIYKDMCHSAAGNKGPVKANEITNESGGFHLIEFHLPTTGISILTILLILLSCFFFYWCYRRSGRSCHSCCLPVVPQGRMDTANPAIPMQPVPATSPAVIAVTSPSSMPVVTSQPPTPLQIQHQLALPPPLPQPLQQQRPPLPPADQPPSRGPSPPPQHEADLKELRRAAAAVTTRSRRSRPLYRRFPNVQTTSGDVSASDSGLNSDDAFPSDSFQVTIDGQRRTVQRVPMGLLLRNTIPPDV